MHIRLGHKARLRITALSIACGTGFLIYSTYVTNNLQVVGEEWLNKTYNDRHGEYPSQEKVTLLWASIIAAKEVGKIVGTLLLPLIAEKTGRRRGLLINNMVVFIGCWLCYIGNQYHYWVIMAGRFLLGTSMICGVGLASLYLIEIAQLAARGWSGSLIQIFRGFGGTLGMALALPQLMGNEKWWGFCMAVPAIPALWLSIVLLFCPESPRHLYITENKEQAAIRAVQFYQGAAETHTAMADLRKEKERISNEEKESHRAIYNTKSFWHVIGIVIVALMNRANAGILLVQSYSTDIFMVAGHSRHIASYSTVILGICHLISAILVALKIDQFGRRPLLVYSNIGCLISLSFVGIFASVRPNQTTSWLTVIFLAIFMLIYPIVASVSNIAATEICHQKIRSLAFTIGLLAYSIVGCLSTFAYPLLKQMLGVAGSVFPYLIALMLTIVVYHFYLPETKDKTFSSVAFVDNNKGGLQRHTDLEPLLSSDQEDGVDSGLHLGAVKEEDNMPNIKIMQSENYASINGTAHWRVNNSSHDLRLNQKFVD